MGVLRFSQAEVLNILEGYRQTNGPEDTLNMYPWDIIHQEATLECITTAQIEYYKKTVHGQNFTPYWQTSRVFVKDPGDSFYASQGCPNPPLGGVFRGIQKNGSLGAHNFLEVPPVFFLVDMALRVGDVANAQKALSFLDWMTVEGSFYGSPIKVIAGIARYENGQWVRKYDTVILRNVAGAAWANFRYANAMGDVARAQKGREFLNVLAMALNNVHRRAQIGDLAPILDGALYAHLWNYSGNNFAFVWNRFSIEGNWMLWMALEEASKWYGWETVLTDAEGTSFTLKELVQRLGAFYDRIFLSGKGIMKHRNPRAPYLPYQFFMEQAWYHDDRMVVGVNFDWTGESGTQYGDTWWVGDLELWGLIGLAYLAQNGYMGFNISPFVYQFEQLAVGGQPIWHDRYSFLGETLVHDPSVSITFTALYGILTSIWTEAEMYPVNIMLDEVSQGGNNTTVILRSQYPARVYVRVYGPGASVPSQTLGPYAVSPNGTTLNLPISNSRRLLVEEIPYDRDNV